MDNLVSIYNPTHFLPSHILEQIQVSCHLRYKYFITDLENIRSSVFIRKSTITNLFTTLKINSVVYILNNASQCKSHFSSDCKNS